MPKLGYRVWHHRNLDGTDGFAWNYRASKCGGVRGCCGDVVKLMEEILSCGNAEESGQETLQSRGSFGGCDVLTLGLKETPFSDTGQDEGTQSAEKVGPLWIAKG